MQIVALSNGNQLVWTFSETLGKPVMPLLRIGIMKNRLHNKKIVLLNFNNNLTHHFIEHHLQYEAGCKANGAKVVV